MAVHIYLNRDDKYVIVDKGIRETIFALLRRANRKSSFGVCVTSSPVQIWLLYPRQVFGFGNEDGEKNIHIGGFGQGSFFPNDYKGDYYELRVLNIELIDKIRSQLPEVDFDLILDWIKIINDMIYNINWSANGHTFPLSLDECLTTNDKICLYLKKIADVLSKYFLVTCPR